MNKWITISIISVLAVGVGVTGVLYAQEKGNVSTLQTELSDSEAIVSNLEGNVSTLEADRAASEVEVSTLGTNLATANARVSTLETNLAASEAEVSTLGTNLAAAKARVSTLETNLAALEAEISTLETNLATANARVSTLETNLAALEAEISALKAGLEAEASAQVNIVFFTFSPATITVPVGTTVTWTQLDAVSHTVTSDTGVFNSSTLYLGDTFSYTFTEGGTFNYHCVFHLFQTGTVIVE